MNVIIANKYRDALADLDVEVIKKLDGEFTVDEIIETFKNFFFQKMILDLTALKDYRDIKTLQKLSLSFDTDKLIVLLDGSPETSNPEYLSDLISMHIYNFTMNVEGIKWLYEHPNSYRDVAQYHQLDTVHGSSASAPVVAAVNNLAPAKKATIVAFKDVTEGAGSTTLVYVSKKQLERNYKVAAIEVDKRDFVYYGDKDLISTTNVDLGNQISKYSDRDIILIDANNSAAAEDLASECLYLVEPSKIKLSKLIAKNPNVLSNIRNKKIVLNKCMLSSQDISDFEYETKLSVFAKIPPINDQSSENKALDEFLGKLGFSKQTAGGGKKGLFK